MNRDETPSPPARPIRVLCLDTEGGYGGSSRSLAKMLRWIDRAAIAPEVWCKREGPTQQAYQEIGIPSQVHADMPTLAALRLPTRNIAVQARFCWQWLQSRGFRNRLLRRIDDFDLVHFNLESLSYLAQWLRPRHRKPQTMHIRTHPYDTWWGRRQERRILDSVDHLVFISENERKNIFKLAGRAAPGTVVYNVVDPPARNVAPHPAIPRDGRLKVAVISNYDWQRGNDRVIDVAALLKQQGRSNFLFVIAGHMQLSRSLPGPLGIIGRRGGTLADYAGMRGVSDMMLFLGHVSDPESVLAACDVLAKPEREDKPWGRDILEGLAFGLPVIGCGYYNRFVENDVTGYLLAPYSDQAMADLLVRLHADPDLRRRLGAAGAARVRELCDGPARAADLAAIWINAVQQGR